MVSGRVAQPDGNGATIHIFAHALFACAMVALSAAPFAPASLGSAPTDPWGVHPATSFGALRRHAYAARMVRRRRFIRVAGFVPLACVAMGWLEADGACYSRLVTRLYRLSFLAAVPVKYRRVAPVFLGCTLLLPVLRLLGFTQAGHQIDNFIERDPNWSEQLLERIKVPPRTFVPSQ